MVVEHEAGAVDGAQDQGDRPEDVGRVAGLNHPEPAGPSCLERQPCRGEEGVGVLGNEAECASAGRVGPVLVQLYRVDDLVRRVAAALGAYDGDLMAG